MELIWGRWGKQETIQKFLARDRVVFSESGERVGLKTKEHLILHIRVDLEAGGTERVADAATLQGGCWCEGCTLSQIRAAPATSEDGDRLSRSPHCVQLQQNKNKLL